MEIDIVEFLDPIYDNIYTCPFNGRTILELSSDEKYKRLIESIIDIYEGEGCIFSSPGKTPIRKISFELNRIYLLDQDNFQITRENNARKAEIELLLSQLDEVAIKLKFRNINLEAFNKYFLSVKSPSLAITSDHLTEIGIETTMRSFKQLNEDSFHNLMYTSKTNSK